MVAIESRSAARQARAQLRKGRYGVLATLSQRLNGYPFGSIAPYVIDHAGCPVILISRLAEHTRNLAADGRASLLVHDHAEDAQAGSRITLVGDAARLGVEPAIRQRYLRLQPQAAQMLALGDFAFWCITPMRIRFIAGFGEICWISAEDFGSLAHLQAAEEEGILATMNGNHGRSLSRCCLRFHGRAAAEVTMIGVDFDGFDLQADSERLRFDFAEPAASALEVLDRLLAMASQATRK